MCCHYWSYKPHVHLYSIYSRILLYMVDACSIIHMLSFSIIYTALALKVSRLLIVMELQNVTQQSYNDQLLQQGLYINFLLFSLQLPIPTVMKSHSS